MQIPPAVPLITMVKNKYGNVWNSKVRPLDDHLEVWQVWSQVNLLKMTAYVCLSSSFMVKGLLTKIVRGTYSINNRFALKQT